MRLGDIPGLIALALGVCSALFGWPIFLAWIFVVIYAVAQVRLSLDMRQALILSRNP